VQLRAIQEVWDLSSLDIETLGKLAGSILKSIGKLNDTGLAEVQNPLIGGLKDLQPEQNS